MAACFSLGTRPVVSVGHRPAAIVRSVVDWSPEGAFVFVHLVNDQKRALHLRKRKKKDKIPNTDKYHI